MAHSSTQPHKPHDEQQSGYSNLDLTQTEPYVLVSPTPQDIPTKPFNSEQHRAVTAGKAVFAIIGLIYFITALAFVSLWIGIEINYIKWLVFTLVALMVVVARPLLNFFFKELPKSDDESGDDQN